MAPRRDVERRTGLTLAFRFQPRKHTSRSSFTLSGTGKASYIVSPYASSAALREHAKTSNGASSAILPVTSSAICACCAWVGSASTPLIVILPALPSEGETLSVERPVGRRRTLHTAPLITWSAESNTAVRATGGIAPRAPL